jgi:response regulator RpfG family c-di-GMP phosphodiesterase
VTLSNQAAPARLLLVDDEPNILRSLQRVLRLDGYSITTAESGDQAVEMMEQAPFDLVLCDARMPGMDGATCLAHSHRLLPDSIRILLTGYADVGTTVKAINEGQIYRYLSKPWNDDELRLTLRQGLALQQAERERLRLTRVVALQNKQLKELNLQLSRQVDARTSELEQTSDMLDLAFDELKQSYLQTTEVFGSLIHLRMPHAKQLNPRVVAYCRNMARLLEWSEADQRELTMAAVLFNVGKLTWTDRLPGVPYEQLTEADREIFRQYPVVSSQIIMGLEPMQGAARIIRHHQERWDGKGVPDGLRAQEIPLGSQLLKMAVDLVELQLGLLYKKRLTLDEAILFMQQKSGRIYSPELLPLFIAHVQEQQEHDLIEDHCVMLDTRRLGPGMILGANLYARSGLLLLNEGKMLTYQIIEKLISFEATEDLPYQVPILRKSV